VKLDTIVFGVSRDDVLSHQAFRDEHGLTVELLADTEAEGRTTRSNSARPVSTSSSRTSW
jgi:peroxiredoxin